MDESAPTLGDVKRCLSLRWADHRYFAICNALANYVEKLGVSNARYLSLKRLSEAAGKSEVDDELLIALNILSTSAPPLLSAAAVLHIDGKEFDLEPEEVDAVIHDDTVVHPQTGAIIPEASRITEIYYTISEDISEVG
ncbi:hypothetical protein [Leisingera daeponensis]|uniref:hypothetical protein n=1 Tax=Leisingera daeponensis TaxID=405746 RepID=UPI001C9842A5|nr:hypothetical protein [Leisingera daeponensis]MBY6056760.1 hypothetical protein [Leisingera daeponensis]